MRIFYSAEYCRRVARRMPHMAFSALSVFLVIIVRLLSYDEPNVSLIQTAQLVRVLLTGNTGVDDCGNGEIRRKALHVGIQLSGRQPLHIL